MNKLDYMVSDMAEGMGVEGMTDSEIEYAIKDAEEAADCATQMLADGSKYILQALALYRERDARRSPIANRPVMPSPAGVCWEYYPDGTSQKLSFTILAF